MRFRLAELALPCCLAACQPSPEAAAPGDTLTLPGCVLDDATPAALHALAYEPGGSLLPRFGPCGHLLVDARPPPASLALVAPDLASLELLPDDLGGEATFAPTGEWLAFDPWPWDADPVVVLRDLRTGGLTRFPSAVASRFASRRAGSGSIHVRCGAEGLVAFDGTTSRVVADPPIACDRRRLVVARAAPVVVFAGAGDRLHVADLEAGTVQELPFDAPAEPDTSVASSVGRTDVIHLSADGRLLLFQRIEAVFDGEDVLPARDGVGEVHLVDLATGTVLGSHPSTRVIGPEDIPGRGHGLLWTTGEATFLVTPDRTVRTFGVGLDLIAWAGPPGVIGARWNVDGAVSWFRLDFDDGSWRLLEPASNWPVVVSAAGRALAAPAPPSGLDSRIDVEGAAPRLVRGLVEWLGDDGAALVHADGRLALLDGSGRERSSVELPQNHRPRVHETPGSLLVDAAGDLHVFDLATGTRRLLGTGLTRVEATTDGRRIAFVVAHEEPSAGETIWAGRLSP